MNIHNDLLNRKCVPCEGGTKPLTLEEVEKLMIKIDGWTLQMKILPMAWSILEFQKNINLLILSER